VPTPLVMFVTWCARLLVRCSAPAESVLACKGMASWQTASAGRC
jgi:hypothetical protein